MLIFLKEDAERQDKRDNAFMKMMANFLHPPAINPNECRHLNFMSSSLTCRMSYGAPQNTNNF